MTDKPKQREVVVQPLVHPDFTPKIIKAIFPSDLDDLIKGPCTLAYISVIKNLKMLFLLNRIKHDELKTRAQWVIDQTGILPNDTDEELEKKLEGSGYYQTVGHVSIIDCAIHKPIAYFTTPKNDSH